MARGLTSVARHHAEWLALIDIAGPFLDLGILTGIFPQGIDGAADDGPQRRRLQMLYEGRLSTPKRNRPELETLWFSTVLREVLEWPESHIREGQAVAHCRLPALWNRIPHPRGASDTCGYRGAIAGTWGDAPAGSRADGSRAEASARARQPVCARSGPQQTCRGQEVGRDSGEPDGRASPPNPKHARSGHQR